MLDSVRRGCALLGLGLLAGVAAFRPAGPAAWGGKAIVGERQRVCRATGTRALVARAGQEFSRKQAKREMMERQRAFAEFQSEIETTPVFQVFAASEKMRGLWMPVAAFKADNVAKGVVDAYLAEGVVAGMFKSVYKAQIESAVAKSIFDNERKLREQGASMHASLRNLPKESTLWGYKILYKPLEEKMGKNIQPTQVTQDMAKSLFDKFKDAVGNSVKDTLNLSFIEQEPAKPAAAQGAQPGQQKETRKAKRKAKKAAAASSQESSSEESA